ncbi:MAG: shikimate dehydrogenase [Candidatus Omnitrophica bacterium]|nr:shikimate dehydrogenase [Candidatus Omnitrophota bacterium]
MDKESSVRIYGVLGYPAKHSLSPLMHNAAFSALKINAEYKIFEKNPDELEKFIRSLFKERIVGLNITIPYKERVIPFLNKVSPGAKLIGAVNTIKADQNKLEGFNTDGEGLLRHLDEDLGFNPKDKTVAIIGAGGAAKAVSLYLAKAKARAINIYDIDKAKALALVNHLKQNFKDTESALADSIRGLKIEGADLLINATPIGMKDTDPCVVDGDFLHKDLLVYDLIYNPGETKLLKVAKQKGARVSNGLGMLLYQGAASFELWTNKPAPIRIMRQALNKGVKRL